MLTRGLLSLALVACLVYPAVGQNRGTADATINGKKVSVEYGRPSLGGRDFQKDILSQASVGMVWRLGMNQPTSITSAGDLVVGGKTLKAGKYSLWAKKTGDQSWVLEFHPQVPGWGDPPLTEGFAAEAPLKYSKSSTNTEQLTMTLAANKGSADLTISWGDAKLSSSFGVK
jgi:hypothetical protein